MDNAISAATLVYYLSFCITSSAMRIFFWNCKTVFKLAISVFQWWKLWLGWFTAYLANVFLTKLQTPILPSKSRDRRNPKLGFLTMHLNTSYHHRQPLFKNVQHYSFYLKISISSRFFAISVMLNIPFWNDHNLWSSPRLTLNYVSIDSE